MPKRTKVTIKYFYVFKNCRPCPPLLLQLKLMLRVIYKVLYQLAKVYWLLFHPQTTGVMVFIKSDSQVLLVRGTYGPSRWHLPGGGVKKGEPVEQAARREVYEEVGMKLNSLEKKGSFLYTGEGKRDTIWVFLSETEEKKFKIQPSEVAEARWFEIKNLGFKKSYVLSKCFRLAGYE